MNQQTIESEKKSSSRKNFASLFGQFTAFALMILIVFGIIKFLTWGYNIISPFYGYTNRSDLQAEISKSIRNGANLNVIRVIFSNRKIEESIKVRWFPDENTHYKEPISLTTLLDDMKAQYFLSDKRDEGYLSSLDSIIAENREINPFDKLYSHQKDFFENIRIKASDKYELIANDVNKISDELHKQNELVKEYLSDATTGLIISITGLALALVVTVIQIFQNRKKSKQDAIKHYGLLAFLDEKLSKKPNMRINSDQNLPK